MSLHKNLLFFCHSFKKEENWENILKVFKIQKLIWLNSWTMNRGNYAVRLIPVKGCNKGFVFCATN